MRVWWRRRASISPGVPSTLRPTSAVSPVAPSSFFAEESYAVVPLTVGPACQHWIMLLADVASTSNQLSGTSSRLSKVSLIADLLRKCARQVFEGAAPADEIGLTTRYISGALRQRRTGIELSGIELSGIAQASVLEAGVAQAGLLER